jgi:dimethylglycine dehydrogenase
VSAVFKQREQKPQWRFIKLIVDSKNADPLIGDSILLDGECIGYVTSGGTGFRVSQCLALGYVSNTVDDGATGFEIEILGDARRATLSNQSFYDADNHRLRS